MGACMGGWAEQRWRTLCVGKASKIEARANRLSDREVLFMRSALKPFTIRFPCNLIRQKQR